MNIHRFPLLAVLISGRVNNSTSNITMQASISRPLLQDGEELPTIEEGRYNIFGGYTNMRILPRPSGSMSHVRVSIPSRKDIVKLLSGISDQELSNLELRHRTTHSGAMRAFTVTQAGGKRRVSIVERYDDADEILFLVEHQSFQREDV